MPGAERKPFVLGEVVESVMFTVVSQDEEWVVDEEEHDCPTCGQVVEERGHTKVTPHPEAVGQKIIRREYTAAVRQACVEWIEDQRREGFEPGWGTGIGELHNGARRRGGVDIWPWADTKSGGDCWVATVEKVVPREDA